MHGLKEGSRRLLMHAIKSSLVKCVFLSCLILSVSPQVVLAGLVQSLLSESKYDHDKDSLVPVTVTTQHYALLHGATGRDDVTMCL